MCTKNSPIFVYGKFNDMQIRDDNGVDQTYRDRSSIHFIDENTSDIFDDEEEIIIVGCQENFDTTSFTSIHDDYLKRSSTRMTGKQFKRFSAKLRQSGRRIKLIPMEERKTNNMTINLPDATLSETEIDDLEDPVRMTSFLNTNMNIDEIKMENSETNFFYKKLAMKLCDNDSEKKDDIDKGKNQMDEIGKSRKRSHSYISSISSSLTVPDGEMYSDEAYYTSSSESVPYYYRSMDICLSSSFPTNINGSCHHSMNVSRYPRCRRRHRTSFNQMRNRYVNNPNSINNSEIHSNIHNQQERNHQLIINNFRRSKCSKWKRYRRHSLTSSFNTNGVVSSSIILSTDSNLISHKSSNHGSSNVDYFSMKTMNSSEMKEQDIELPATKLSHLDQENLSDENSSINHPTTITTQMITTSDESITSIQDTSSNFQTNKNKLFFQRQNKLIIEDEQYSQIFNGKEYQQLSHEKNENDLTNIQKQLNDLIGHEDLLQSKNKKIAESQIIVSANDFPNRQEFARSIVSLNELSGKNPDMIQKDINEIFQHNSIDNNNNNNNNNNEEKKEQSSIHNDVKAEDVNDGKVVDQLQILEDNELRNTNSFSPEFIFHRLPLRSIYLCGMIFFALLAGIFLCLYVVKLMVFDDHHTNERSPFPFHYTTTNNPKFSHLKDNYHYSTVNSHQKDSLLFSIPNFHIQLFDHRSLSIKSIKSTNTSQIINREFKFISSVSQCASLNEWKKGESKSSNAFYYQIKKSENCRYDFWPENIQSIIDFTSNQSNSFIINYYINFNTNENYNNSIPPFFIHQLQLLPNDQVYFKNSSKFLDNKNLGRPVISVDSSEFDMIIENNKETINIISSMDSYEINENNQLSPKVDSNDYIKEKVDDEYVFSIKYRIEYQFN
ncbi:hypothetical protein SNEBB_002874 [Seison nebaliae]|nr:hypothetical protein SNEBB_002874 [Seison nebaliae]